MIEAIVSHVANQAYRDHVDEMTCKADGCRRWRADGSTRFCSDHCGKNVFRSREFTAEELGGTRVIKLVGLRDCADSLPADHVPGIGQNIKREIR